MRRKLLLVSQVLGQPQEQEQLSPATAQGLAGHELKQGHGEGSDFWLTGWAVACESPLQGISNHTWEAQPEHMVKYNTQ